MMFCSLAFAVILLALFSGAKAEEKFKQFKWISENNHYWAKSCDWYGNDLNNSRISRAKCAPACAEDNACTHFTWTLFEGGACWLKMGPISLEQATNMFEATVNVDPAATADNYPICGIMKRAIQGIQSASKRAPVVVKSAKTSRYWDCCKPSCAWPGKANVDVTDQVMSCSQDGWKWLVNVPNMPDICQGGTAFGCGQYQPMVVTDTLSYAYASAHLVGQSERELCCVCYELTITNSPARGKKIIVQVISSAVNYGVDYFNLMIPGGGVGMLNGCTAQWGAPKDGWGARNGGVSNKRNCFQLPKSLQDGCLWRFDWLMDADNPNVNYTRVTCPSQLVLQSNCRRSDE